jgi:hypothetical protein
VVINVKDHGAICDANATGSSGTDDTAAVQAAIDAASALGGGTVFVPAHTKCVGRLSLVGKNSITLEGPAGSGVGYSAPPPGQLIFTGTGSSPFIDCAHSNAVAVRNLGVRNNNSGFTGDLIFAGNITNGADCAFFLAERCLIGGTPGIHSARSCISFEGNILSSAIDNNIGWAQAGLRGQKEVATGNVLYSNALTIERNTFQNLTIAGIVNPGIGWTIIGNWFEGTNDGSSGGMPKAVYVDISAASTPSVLWSFIGNWLGDATNVTVTWLDFNHATVAGVISGNYFSTLNPATISAMKLGAGARGLAITGNNLTYIDLNGVDHYGLTISGNFMYTPITTLTAASSSIYIFGNRQDQAVSAVDIIRAGGAIEFGLGHGSGGSVTQTGSRTNGVTINKLCGQIVLFNAAGSATWSNFFVTNSLVKAIDTVTVSQQNDGSSNHYNAFAVPTAGGFALWFQSIDGTATETIVLNFRVHSGSAD